MILNVTDKPFFAFSAMQRLATHGVRVVTRSRPVRSVDDFYALLDAYENVVTKVIIDKSDFVLANDICNAVTCPVVTLDIEIDAITGNVEFIEYDPYERV